MIDNLNCFNAITPKIYATNYATKLAKRVIFVAKSG